MKLENALELATAVDFGGNFLSVVSYDTETQDLYCLDHDSGEDYIFTLTDIKEFETYKIYTLEELLIT